MFRTKFYLVAGALTLLFAACQQQQLGQVEVTPSTERQESREAEPPVAESKQATLPRRETKVPAEKLPEQAAVKPISPLPSPFVPKAPGRRVARVDVPGPYVALTFDDGPSPSNTPKILDILKRHGAHATFFVAGENAVNNKGILARAAAEGHEIGSHTYSHIKLTGSSDEKIEREMSRTGSIIEEATGRKPVLMRPPYGATNKRIVDKMYNDYGMTSVLWDVDTQDWRHPGVEIVVRRAVGNARAGSIILVHDIHASTLAAVEDIVVGLQARGFKLVTVSQLMALGAGPAAPKAAPVAEPESAPEPAAEILPAAPPASASVSPADPQGEPSDHTPGSASISVEHTPDESHDE